MTFEGSESKGSGDVQARRSVFAVQSCVESNSEDGFAKCTQVAFASGWLRTTLNVTDNRS